METFDKKAEITLAEEYYSEAREKMMQKKYYDAISLIQNALWILENSEAYELYRKSLILLGVAYSTIGNFGMSDDIYLNGIAWCQQNNLPEFLYEFYNNIASSFLNFKEPKTALKYFEYAEKSNELRKEKNPESYLLWDFLIKLNKMISYLDLQDYKMAEVLERELDIARNQIELPNYMLFSYRVAKADLFAQTGRIEESEKLSEKLFREDEMFSIYNYYENLGRLCAIFKRLDRMDLWATTLELSEKYVQNEESIHLALTLTGKWLEYYDYTRNEDAYQITGIEYTRLSVKQQQLWEREHIQFLQKKIDFQISRKKYRQNEKKMYVDYLTKTRNREALQKDYVSWNDKDQKEQYSCIGMLDIDNFKTWNDTYGHLKGDECLQKVASVLLQNIGDVGKVYRFGGDEFLVLMSISDMEQIETIAKKISDTCKNSEDKITLSQGYVCWKNEKSMSLREGISKADEQLYAVKKAGRNNFKIKEA